MKHNLFHVCSAGWLMLMAVVCGGLTACQPKYDPMEAIGEMADQNIPRTYSVVKVDTSALVSTITEYELVKDGTGSFLSSTSGNGQDILTSKQDITWSRGEYVDNGAYVSILINMAQGGSKTLKWSSKTLFENGVILMPGKYSSAMNSVFKNFSNTSWKTKSDSTWFKTEFKYLGWDQAKGSAARLTQAQIDEKRAYFAQQWVKDTIAWYNKNFDANVPDSIRVVGPYGTTNKFQCVFWVGKEKTTYIDQPIPGKEKRFSVSKLTVSRAEDTFLNRGLYTYHYFEQDSAHYLNPESPKANANDSLYQFDIQGWCVGSVTGTSTFNLVAKGDLKQVVWRTEGGHRDTLLNVVKQNCVKTFVITNHDPNDKAMIDEVWHYYQK